LVASEAFAAQLRERITVPVEVMYQATDPSRFFPDPDPGLATDLLFVGNSRGTERVAVRSALEVGAPLKVYGQDWEDTLGPDVLQADHFPNERLRTLYSSAGVTLNDHWPEMAEHGFISNRIFDIVAAGGVVFTDHVAGLGNVFGDLIPVFQSPEELRGLLEDRHQNPGLYANRMAEARKIVLADHTFAARARRLMELVDQLGWEPTARLGDY
jgi:spore maturation protein CgeB